jgi:DMSO/TMAO reductase YedYZ molybdopterin-dependent catalytic subunit
MRIGSLLSMLLIVATLAFSQGAPAESHAAVRIGGAVPQPLTLTGAELAEMPRTSVTASAHHVSGTWEGVTVRELLSRAGVPSGTQLPGPALAASVIVTGSDGYRVAFGLAEFDAQFTDRVAILADRKDGAPLTGNAAPFQLIITGEKRPARWVRQVISIDLVAHGTVTSKP